MSYKRVTGTKSMARNITNRKALAAFSIFFIAIFLLFGIFSQIIDLKPYFKRALSPARAAAPFFQITELGMKDTELPATISGAKTLRALVYSSVDETHLNSLSFYLKNTDTNGVSVIVGTSLGSLDPTTNTEEWTADITTVGFADGNYELTATGLYSNSTLNSQQKVTFTIYNGPLDTIGISVKFVNPPVSPVSGNKDIFISTNPAADSVKFNVSSVEFAGTPSEQLPNTNFVYKFTWKTTDFANGDYTITANVQKGTTKNSASLNLSVDNGSVTPTPTPEIIPTPQPTLEPTPTPTPDLTPTPTWTPIPNVYVTPSPVPEITPESTPDLPVESAAPSPDPKDDPKQDNGLLLECRERGITSVEDCRRYLLVPLQCGRQNILDLDKCKEYLFKQAMPEDCLKQNTDTQAKCTAIIFSNAMPEECRKANISDPVRCAELLTEQPVLSKDCKEQNINKAEECGYMTREKYENLKDKILSPDSSEDCRQMNVEGKDECNKALFGKYAPEECNEAGIYDLSRCEKVVFDKYAPADCIEKGILDPGFCKNYIFEKYDHLNNIPFEKLPIECRKSGVASARECGKMMKEKYLPEKCKSRGLEDPDQCSSYLEQSLSRECRDIGAKSSGECGRLLLKKNARKECRYIGINDDKECNSFLFNMYVPKVTCIGSDEWQCDNLVKNDYLGNIIAGQIRFDKISREMASLAGRSIKAGSLNEKIGADAWMIPIADSNANFKVELLEDKMVVGGQGDFMQTAPMALMIDTDGDSAPDDLEVRLGTDPFKADTDGDNYRDGDEVKKGFNPLGEGNVSDEFKAKISGIDQAILDNKTLGDAGTSGAESNTLAVNEVSGAESEGYVFSGKAEKNSVVTIYVYSGFPLIMTAKTDENGDWKYELDKTLVDGEHDAYAALNDVSGNVVGKSKPFSFFIKNGKRISFEDFIILQSGAKPSESAKKPFDYMIMVVAVLVAIVIIFVIWIIKRRRPAAY